MAEKSLFTTYLLWLCGGVFGLHHFYLGRDFQALVWSLFIGGYFGLGLIRDLWRIPEYVRDANEEPEYIAELAEKMRKSDKPPTGTIRYIGLQIVSGAFGHLVLGAIPSDTILDVYRTPISAIFVPFAVSLGIYAVGNIGRHEGSLVSALKGAYITSPLYFVMHEPVLLTSLAAVSYFNSHTKWRRTPKPKKSFAYRITFLSFWGIIYLSLWGSWFYFNCTVTVQETGTMKCRDALKNFFKSPLWREFINVIKQIWKTIQTHGWRETWSQLIMALDPTGETNAIKVLGVKSSATQEEITARYRKLSREWHPDRHKDMEQKLIAQEKFIEIQQAYEILSKIKTKRVAQNVKDQTEDILREEYRE